MTTLVNMQCKNGSPVRKQKAYDGAVLLHRVINSEEFKARVLSFKKFTSNPYKLSNQQIYDLIMSGKEKLNPELDYEWDFQVSFYTKKLSKTVGFTFPNITYINCNTKFFDKYSLAEVAGNFGHEYFHKLGFDHVSATEYTSIPYAIGYIIRDLALEILKNP